jgi:hypothetical protein
MFKCIEMKLGDSLVLPIERKEVEKDVKQKIFQIRKDFLNEFGIIPPVIKYMASDEIFDWAFGFDLKGWSNVYHEINHIDYALENKYELHDKVFFYLKRFLRKWYMNCPDMLIEDKMRDLPVVIECGEKLAPLMESPDFQKILQGKCFQMGIFNTKFNIWESDFVSNEEVVMYIYGEDYFFKKEVLFKDTFEMYDVVLNELILPVLSENREKLRAIPY